MERSFFVLSFLPIILAPSLLLVMDTPSDANDTCVGPSSENAGKASSCAGCPNQGACASGEAKKAEPIGLGM